MSVKYTGNSSILNIGKETTFATQVAASITLPFMTASPAPSNALISNNTPSGGRSTAQPGAGQFKNALSINSYVKLDSLGHLATGALGLDTVTSGASGMHIHTITMSALPSYTVAIDDGAGYVNYNPGSKFGKISFSASPGQFLMAQVDVTSVTVAKTAGVLTPAYSSAPDMEWANLSAGVGGSVSINSVTTAITKFSLSVDNMLQESWDSNGARFVSALTSTGSKITGSVDIEYGSDTGAAEEIETIFYGALGGPVAANIPRVPISIKFADGSGSSVAFNLGSVTIDKVSGPREKGKLITRSVSFTASQSTGTASDDLVIVLTNSAASAY